MIRESKPILETAEKLLRNVSPRKVMCIDIPLASKDSLRVLDKCAEYVWYTRCLFLSSMRYSSDAQMMLLSV